MIDLLIKTCSIFFTVFIIFFFGKIKGSYEEKKKQLKSENDELQENARINKKNDNMSFIDKSEFLLSKQKNRNKNN
jgi:hypothetical protein